MSKPNKPPIILDFIKCGDTIHIPIENICNLSKVPATGVEVYFDTPSGLTFLTANLPQGSYDEVTGIWTIGTLYPGQVLTPDATIFYQVEDDCLAPFRWDITIGSTDACEECLENNSYCVKVDGLTCCDVKECITQGDLVCEPDNCLSF